MPNWYLHTTTTVDYQLLINMLTNRLLGRALTRAAGTIVKWLGLNSIANDVKVKPKRRGVNLGKKFSAETRSRMSLAKRGRTPNRAGTEAARLVNLGRRPHNLGLPLDPATKLKMNESRLRHHMARLYAGSTPSTTERDALVPEEIKIYRAGFGRLSYKNWLAGLSHR